jgi:hypothetical protein
MLMVTVNGAELKIQHQVSSIQHLHGKCNSISNFGNAGIKLSMIIGEYDGAKRHPQIFNLHSSIVN